MDEIVKVTRRSIDALVKVDDEAQHQNTGGMFSKIEIKEQILQRLGEGHELFFAYKRNKEIIAYATLNRFFPGYKHCEIYWLNVRRDFQGEGVGSKLLKYIEDYAKEDGFRRICIYTGKTMKKTIHFYEKNGYKLINEFPDYYGFSKGSRTAVLYGKKL